MKVYISIILTISILILSTISCEKEESNIENELIGKWVHTHTTINGSVISLSNCEKLEAIDLQANNICLIYDVCNDLIINSGWNYKSGMLNISEYLPAAFYIEELDNTSLKISRKDINSEGNLQTTILDYIKE